LFPFLEQGLQKLASMQRRWRSFVVVLAILTTAFPARAARPPSNADRFLARLPNSSLPQLEDFNRRSASVPEIVEFEVEGFSDSREEYAGDLYTYRINRNAYERRQAAGRAATQNGLANSPGHHHHRHGSIKRFAVFARCVVRAYYLHSFHVSNNPEDPVDPGVPNDPLCPLPYQTYLKRAERFAEIFFGIRV
jgi:hypothetical protein